MTEDLRGIAEQDLGALDQAAVARVVDRVVPPVPLDVAAFNSSI